jgi:hypothetical protein
MAISLLLRDGHYAPGIFARQSMPDGCGGSGKHQRAMG